ncbi:MAG: hypothetical protein L6R43_18355 [Planctomycetes bacterium]|nr:hypothetical protein [Planctomycetota bacterium]
MKARNAGRANFLLVYVREAHASDEWVTPDNEKAGIRYPQPRTEEERRAAALRCLEGLRTTMPVVVDGMDDAVARAWGAWPDRLYVIDAEGRVAWRGGPGPFGFLPAEAEEALARLEEGGRRP